MSVPVGSFNWSIQNMQTEICCYNNKMKNKQKKDTRLTVRMPPEFFSINKLSNAVNSV